MRALVLAAALAASTASAAAQESLLSAEVDAERVGVEDTLELTIRLSGAAAALQGAPLPELEKLRLVGGPSVSTQVSMIGGSVTQSKALTWVLQPTATGTARIGATQVSVDGETHASSPIQVEVVPGRVKPQRGGRRSGDPFGDPFGDLFDSPFRQRAPQREPKLEVRAVPSRTRLHVGEPLLLTYYLYTQVSITDYGFADAPQYPGFWSEPLERPEGPRGGEVAELAGERYQRFPVMQRLLFPTREGRLEIPPAAFRLGIQPRSFFQGRSVVERPVGAVTIEALPLPQAPDFQGAVGRFQASASVDKHELELGDAATLRFRVQGTGNLKWIERPPQLDVPGAKVYPPQETSDLQVGPAGVSGSRSWEFVVVPETAGELEIPPLSFVYFDPQAKRLERVATAPIALAVSGSAGARIAAGPAGPSRARDGLALRAELELPAAASVDVAGTRLALALLLAGLLHAAIWLGPGLLERGRGAARRAPQRDVKHALAELRRASHDGVTKEAAAALIEKTLHDLFGPLSEAAGDGERERAARSLLEQVQFIRYAPQLGDYSEQIRDAARRAAELVRKWA